VSTTRSRHPDCALANLLKDANFTLRTQCQCASDHLDASGKQATGVTYVDASGREFGAARHASESSACSLLNNVRMLLLSGIGKAYDPVSGEGVVGRSYAYQTVGAANVFFDKASTSNPFMRSGASGTVISELRELQLRPRPL